VTGAGVKRTYLRIQESAGAEVPSEVCVGNQTHGPTGQLEEGKRHGRGFSNRKKKKKEALTESASFYKDEAGERKPYR